MVPRRLPTFQSMALHTLMLIEAALNELCVFKERHMKLERKSGSGGIEKELEDRECGRFDLSTLYACINSEILKQMLYLFLFKSHVTFTSFCSPAGSPECCNYRHVPSCLDHMTFWMHFKSLVKYTEYLVYLISYGNY